MGEAGISASAGSISTCASIGIVTPGVLGLVVHGGRVAKAPSGRGQTEGVVLSADERGRRGRIVHETALGHEVDGSVGNGPRGEVGVLVWVLEAVALPWLAGLELGNAEAIADAVQSLHCGRRCGCAVAVAVLAVRPPGGGRGGGHTPGVVDAEAHLGRARLGREGVTGTLGKLPLREAGAPGRLGAAAAAAHAQRVEQVGHRLLGRVRRRQGGACAATSASNSTSAAHGWDGTAPGKGVAARTWPASHLALEVGGLLGRDLVLQVRDVLLGLGDVDRDGEEVVAVTHPLLRLRHAVLLLECLQILDLLKQLVKQD